MQTASFGTTFPTPTTSKINTKGHQILIVGENKTQQTSLDSLHSTTKAISVKKSIDKPEEIAIEEPITKAEEVESTEYETGIDFKTIAYGP